jgi:acyl-CoA hydrolase
MSFTESELFEEGFEIVTRHLILDRDLNHFGHLFGGTLLHWLDESAYLYTVEKSGYGNLVTVSVDGVHFKSPARRGNDILIFGKILRTGRSSIEADMRACAKEPMDGSLREIIHSTFKFVALKDEKPFSWFQSDEYLQRLS